MKTITVRRLDLQFDAGQITHGSSARQVDQAIELINLTLQWEGRVVARSPRRKVPQSSAQALALPLAR